MCVGGEGWVLGLVVADLRSLPMRREERGYRRSSDGQETPDLKGSPALPRCWSESGCSSSNTFLTGGPPSWLLAALLGLVPFHPGPRVTHWVTVPRVWCWDERDGGQDLEP